MLNTLLSEEVRAAEKIEFLSTEFEIPATESFESEVKIMCNLSQGIEQKGIEKGDLKRAIKVARKMIEDNFSMAMIEYYTGLPAEEIKKIVVM